MNVLIKLADNKKTYEGKKIDIPVKLISPDGETIFTRLFRKCIPKQISPPTLNTQANKIEVELMEFSCDNSEAV